MSEIISGRRSISATDLAGRAARAATGLTTLGVGRGDLIAIHLRNDFAFFEASIAAGLIGAYPTPVNWHYKPDEARYLFQNSGAKAIITHTDLIGGVRDALPASVPVLTVATPPEILEAYRINSSEISLTGTLDWGTWIDAFQEYGDTAVAPPGSVIYTSGTTGLPKGVVRHPPTPAQSIAHSEQLARIFGYADPRPHPAIAVVTGPMYHSAPNAFALTSYRLADVTILQPRFDAEGLLRLIDRHRVTHIFMVPIMFKRLLSLPGAVKARYNLSSLEYVVHAAAPCPPAIKEAMISWWGPIIYEYYGSTETSAVTLCNSTDWLENPGTVGRPMTGSIVRVINEAGAPVPAGQTGEIVARTPEIPDFSYHLDIEKRIRADRSGMIATGDIGYFNEAGFLFLCDRANDMIISGGANIYPAEVEAELQKIPGIADCGVFGIPDEEFGEAVCAAVQRSAGSGPSEADIRQFLVSRMASYKIPKRIDFHENLPREDSGKIFKRKLKAPFWAGLERSI